MMGTMELQGFIMRGPANLARICVVYLVLLGASPVDRAIGISVTAPVSPGVSAPTPILEDDIRCLQTIKKTVIDPHHHLYTWNFNNNTPGFICNFLGIDCWQPNVNRVLNIKLPGMSLYGSFPTGFEYCGTMTGLDLSDNNLSGIIPVNLSKWLPFLTSLDLSHNNFQGSIPAELSNCTYLNIIHLQENQLSGEIPWELSRLGRLGDFNVRSNLLSGPIPPFRRGGSFNSAIIIDNRGSFDASNFENNSALCGFPLKPCKEETKETIKISGPLGIVAATACGVVIGFLLVVALWWICLRSLSTYNWLRQRQMITNGPTR